jgi:diguanylate cyclase (GGDEF)-like protein/putative nucleotidyltransferase with HDIG domain
MSWTSQITARVFITAMAVAALVCFVVAFFHWQSSDPIKFVCYMIAALLASSLKVSLPGIEGTLSVNFLFTLLGILELSMPETLLIGVVSTLAQFYWRPAGNLKSVQLIFNLSQVTVSSAAAYAAYQVIATYVLHGPGPLALLVAAITHFSFNTAAMSTIISLTGDRSISKVWTESYLWSFPYYMVGAAIAGLINFLNGHIGWQSSLLVLPPIYLMYRSYRLYLGKLEAEKRHAEKVSSLHLRTIEALALAIEAKDQTTGDHLQRVRIYAMELARELGLTEDETEALRAASVLHDIGKLAVPEHIISKPGKLTPEEFEKMKIHPIVGAEILEQVDFPYPVVPIVRAHHEKWDGSGYPNGLKGEAIPIGARILAAVDCLDALASDRQYRKALPLNEAMAKVASEAGISFDPRVVGILQRRYVELEKLAHDEPFKAPPKLSTDIRVERGLAPAAGFAESEAPVVSAAQPATRCLDSIAQARQDGQVLFGLTQDASVSLSLADTFSLLAVRLQHLAAHDAMAVYLQKGNVLLPEFASGQNASLFSSLKIPLGEGLSGWVAQNDKPILNGNPSVEPGYLNDPKKYSVLRSALAVPLSGVSGVTAVLALYRTQSDAFTRDDLRIVQAMGSRLGFTVENTLQNRLAAATTAAATTTDPLTGLPNARALFQHLEAEITSSNVSGVPLAVFLSGLNGFKQVNHRFGNAQGDNLLQLFAAALKDCCRKYDYAARTGGDEFVIVAPGLTQDAATETIQKIEAMGAQASRTVCRDQSVSISIGQAFYPADGSTAEQLLAQADQRMLRARNSRLAKPANGGAKPRAAGTSAGAD